MTSKVTNLKRKKCKNCGIPFVTTSCSATVCSVECKLKKIMDNLHCDKHGILFKGDYRIRRPDTYPQLVCLQCHNEWMNAPERAEARKARKKSYVAKNPDKHREINTRHAAKVREELGDNYLKELITSDGSITQKQVTEEMVEIKRYQMMIKRILKGKRETRWQMS